MRDVAVEGRTIIFVSHDIEAVSSLCNKAILLDKGKIVSIGGVHEIVHQYTNNYQDAFKSWKENERPGDDTVLLNNVWIIDENNNKIISSGIQQKMGVVVSYDVLKDDSRPAPNLHFYTGTNSLAFVAICEVERLSKGRYESVIWIPENLLNNITYRIGVAITTLNPFNLHLYEREIISIQITENRIGRDSEFGGEFPGTVRPQFRTMTSKIE